MGVERGRAACGWRLGADSVTPGRAAVACAGNRVEVLGMGALERFEAKGVLTFGVVRVGVEGIQ